MRIDADERRGSHLAERRLMEMDTLLLDDDFLKDMICCLGAGSQKNGRAPNDWQKQSHSGARVRHIAKILRHLSHYMEQTGPTAREHAAAIACNAMILWYFS